jgi:3-hydroxyisobutyrate dehydrogenase-like beta-hydroxyacid dehydrogenase
MDWCAPVSDRPVIGFVGLGNMGAPMCARLAGAGFTVHAHDLDPARLDTAVAAGARAAGSAPAAAEAADVLLTSLPRPDHVEAVMRTAGTLTALRPGATLVDLTTDRLALVRELAREAPEGVSVLDCPLTGAVDGARNGRLTMYLGGADTDVDRVRPVLEHLGRVIACGPLGSGTVVKLVTNQLWFVHAAALGEAFALGVAHGVDLGVLWESIKVGAGGSWVAEHDGPSIFAGHYDPSFAIGLCLKDLGLIDELTDAVDTDLPVTTAAHRAFGVAGERYGPDSPELGVVRRIEQDAGLSFRLAGDWTPPWER